MTDVNMNRIQPKMIPASSGADAGSVFAAVNKPGWQHVPDAPATSSLQSSGRDGVQLFPEPADCCVPGACWLRRSLDVIDELLSTPGAVSRDEMDSLLDFRSLLRAREDAEAVVRQFCALRLRLERRHYLAFYRLRRWLEHHVIGEVRACPAAPAVRVRFRLENYCAEAVRRSCLCAALQQGVPLLAPRLRFRFDSAGVGNH